MKNQSDTIIYLAHYRYKIQFILGILSTIIFGRSLFQELASDTALFTLISLGIALWSARDIWRYVEFTTRSVIFHRGFGTSPNEVDLRQMSSISEEGRMGRSITLLYHPKQPDGLLDLDTVNSLIFPQLRDQEELYSKLEAAIPV